MISKLKAAYDKWFQLPTADEALARHREKVALELVPSRVEAEGKANAAAVGYRNRVINDYYRMRGEMLTAREEAEAANAEANSLEDGIARLRKSHPDFEELK